MPLQSSNIPNHATYHQDSHVNLGCLTIFPSESCKRRTEEDSEEGEESEEEESDIISLRSQNKKKVTGKIYQKKKPAQLFRQKKFFSQASTHSINVASLNCITQYLQATPILPEYSSKKEPQLISPIISATHRFNGRHVMKE